MKLRRENVGNCGAGALNNCKYKQTRDVAAGQVLPLCAVVVTKLDSGRENTSLQWVVVWGVFCVEFVYGFFGGSSGTCPVSPGPQGTVV